MRCGLNDKSSSSLCVFHPSKPKSAGGAGDLLYSSDWHLCREKCKSSASDYQAQGCKTFKQHFYGTNVPYKPRKSSQSPKRAQPEAYAGTTESKSTMTDVSLMFNPFTSESVEIKTPRRRSQRRHEIKIEDALSKSAVSSKTARSELYTEKTTECPKHARHIHSRSRSRHRESSASIGRLSAEETVRQIMQSRHDKSSLSSSKRDINLKASQGMLTASQLQTDMYRTTEVSPHSSQRRLDKYLLTSQFGASAMTEQKTAKTLKQSDLVNSFGNAN